MIELFSKLFGILDGGERRNACLLFGLMLIRGLIEAAGVASIIPFMVVLADPSHIHSNTYLAYAYAALGCTSDRGFLVYLTWFVIAVLLLRITIAALSQYAIARYSQMRSFTLSTRLLESYLNHPYTWFLHRHSADLGKSVLSEVDQVVSGSLLPAVELLSQVIVAVFVFGLVVIVQPTVAVTSVLLLGGFYALTYLALQKYLGRIGQERLQANKQRFQVAQEALAGIKEVKLGGLENTYSRRYKSAAHRFSSRRASHMVLREMPRHILEAATFGGALLVTLYLVHKDGSNLLNALPILALFALAATRLLPALHKIYQSSVMLKFGQAALDSLHSELAIERSPQMPQPAAGDALVLTRAIELADVTYQYPKASAPSLEKISLTIKANTTVGFVGRTGAGKSTAIDLIMGLLRPSAGELRVDGVPITAENVRAWQPAIGYVPQHIFLADDTIAGNIAFGVAPRYIDAKAVERAARMAKIHDFVETLPGKYQTTVGERGVRLSGGQRQRIGIARALYHDPHVLVMDEATSALDSLTERALMDAIHNLAHRKTIILVAHRLSTVRACDRIFLFDQGLLKASGAYEDLLNADVGFRQMVTTLAA